MSAAKWHLVIDVARCHDCNDCFLACKDEHVDNAFPGYSAPQPWHGQRWLNILRKERGTFPKVQVAYLPVPCLHCDEPPCVVGDGSAYKREDGIVIIDPQKAIGRKDLVEKCPYEAIYWNEELNLPQKCVGCAHLLDEGWKDTRCSQICPTEATKLVLVDDEEMARIAAEQGLRTLHPELGLKPRVYYKNLDRWDKHFVSASAILGDSGECAEGARATLLRDGSAIAKRIANTFGDLMFDGLEPGSYRLSVEAPGYEALSVDLYLMESVDVGDIVLQRS
jgi:Fe-S-cluster-containing dehydrogenase component